MNTEEGPFCERQDEGCVCVRRVCVCVYLLLCLMINEDGPFFGDQNEMCVCLYV